MDTNYILGPNGELYHWGIKGMRWGVRRYQNKDGSLTVAGRKHYSAENEKLKAREKAIKGREKAAARQAKLDAKKAELDAREAALKNKKKPNADDEKAAASKPKTMRDMTDDELREYTTRMQLEKQYIEAQKNLAAAMPEKVSRGQKFMRSVMNDVVVPAAKSAGKDWAENLMKEKLGLKSPADELKALENEYKKLEWRVKTDDLKKAGTLKESKGENWDSELKRQQYEENERKRIREAKERNIAKERDAYEAETKRIQNEIARSKAERGRMEEEILRAEKDAEYEEWRKKRQGQGGS